MMPKSKIKYMQDSRQCYCFDLAWTPPEYIRIVTHSKAVTVIRCYCVTIIIYAIGLMLQLISFCIGINNLHATVNTCSPRVSCS